MNRELLVQSSLFLLGVLYAEIAETVAAVDAAAREATLGPCAVVGVFHLAQNPPREHMPWREGYTAATLLCVFTTPKVARAVQRRFPNSRAAATHPPNRHMVNRALHTFLNRSECLGGQLPGVSERQRGRVRAGAVDTLSAPITAAQRLYAAVLTGRSGFVPDWVAVRSALVVAGGEGAVEVDEAAVAAAWLSMMAAERERRHQIGRPRRRSRSSGQLADGAVPGADRPPAIPVAESVRRTTSTQTDVARDAVRRTPRLRLEGFGSPVPRRPGTPSPAKRDRTAEQVGERHSIVWPRGVDGSPSLVPEDLRAEEEEDIER